MSDWIACSDRLPELRDDGVLAYFAGTDSIETVNIDFNFKPITAGVGENGEQLWSYWYLSAGITHWMPLPAPPEI